MNRGVAVFLFLLFLAPAVNAATGPELRSGVFKPPRLAPDFSLRGSDGAELRLSRYRGKVIALGFGFTSCPDVCPVTLAKLAQVRKQLGAAAKEFQVVYVTVDPERDNAEVMRKYLTAFDPTFIGATGTPGQLADVREAYGILASKQMVKGSQSDYVVHHSSFVYLIDREGYLRAMVPFGGPRDDVAHDVISLIGK